MDSIPVRGKLPEWEKEDNRTKLFSILLEKSLTFTKLLEETGFARATLSNHLQDLQESGVIERALDGKDVVYRLTLNDEAFESEFKKGSFDFMLTVLSHYDAAMALVFKITQKLGSKFILETKQRMIEGRPIISEKEWEKISVNYIRSELTPAELQIMEENVKLWPNFRPFIKASSKSRTYREEVKK